MFVKHLTAWCAVAVALLAPAGAARAERLVSAHFLVHTNDDNKDYDTGVWVQVVTADGRSLLASVENAANSTEFRDHSDNRIRLAVRNPGATVAQCLGFRFRVGTLANGNDKWKFRGVVILRFDDGRVLRQQIGSTELNSRGSGFVSTGWAGGR